jgi:hypothetical protein
MNKLNRCFYGNQSNITLNYLILNKLNFAFLAYKMHE